MRQLFQSLLGLTDAAIAPAIADAPDANGVASRLRDLISSNFRARVFPVHPDRLGGQPGAAADVLRRNAEAVTQDLTRARQDALDAVNELEAAGDLLAIVADENMATQFALNMAGLAAMGAPYPAEDQVAPDAAVIDDIVAGPHHHGGRLTVHWHSAVRILILMVAGQVIVIVTRRQLLLSGAPLRIVHASNR